MSDIEQISKDLKDTPFLKDLRNEFVVRGLGSLPGRETTIALVGLLLEHHPEWKKKPPADYEIARLLRTSPKKVRNIRDEISYRAPERGDEWCRQNLAEILQHAERVPDGNYVAFTIDDGLTRDYAEKIVRENIGVYETGIKPSVVKISGQTFVTLVLSVIPEDQRDQIISRVPKENLQEHQSTEKPKSLIRLFVESFVESAGKEAGKQAVDLGFTILTGGANKIDGALKLVDKIVNKLQGKDSQNDDHDDGQE